MERVRQLRNGSTHTFILCDNTTWFLLVFYFRIHGASIRDLGLLRGGGSFSDRLLRLLNLLQ